MISLIHFACSFLAQETSFDYSTSQNPPGPVFWICWAAFVILMVASMWKVFSKAGQPGWASIIPFYNLYIMLKIAGKPGWWLILMFVPLVNGACPVGNISFFGLGEMLVFMVILLVGFVYVWKKGALQWD